MDKRRRRTSIIVTLIVLLFIGGFVALVLVDRSQKAASTPPEGVESFSNLSRNHTTNPVSYPQSPPVGGDHNPVWQNCGFYDKPIQNENGVHSLEHGAVWITYQPDLPSEQVDTLRKLAQSQDYILVSPYPDLPAPVVASAWGKQLQLDSTNDPRLEQFVSAFRLGPQTQEPGAPCTAGIGEPSR
ncbi:MAG: DUF3105 domain-containing protein [Rubrobacter sp.]|nr:DUF3105 domain-containing protein [Rubrobacter sp.]